MFTKRIIPCLDVNKGRVVKGVNFVDLKDAGDPVEIAKAYDAAGADAILSREREKIWEIMDSLVADRSVFSVLSYQDLFHNLKAAVKASILQGAAPNIFFSDCSIDGEDMVKFLTDKEYDRFPEDMREAAREAYETFLHTRDGQLADIIVDRAALDAIKKAGERSKEEIVRQYAESTVAVADIRIAVRACKTGKSSDFMKKAMAKCDTLDKERLIHAAVSGSMEGIKKNGEIYDTARMRSEELGSIGFFGAENLSTQTNVGKEVQVTYDLDTISSYGNLSWHLRTEGKSAVINPVKHIRRLRAAQAVLREMGE